MTDAQPEPQRVANPDEDGFLYHYTSLEAFKSIIENKVLWATHIEYLNDTTENSLMKTLVAKRLGELALHEKDPESMRRLKAQFETGERFAFFIACFSEDRGDRLSQWRAYGGSSGVCMAFNKSALEEFCLASLESEASIFLPVDYIPPEGNERTDERIREILEQVEVPNNIYYEAYLAGSILKHDAFAEEQEWRIVTHPWNRPAKFRLRGSLLVPYIELRFDDKLKDLLATVTLGPMNHQQQTAESVSAMLIANRLKTTQVRRSQIPYRGF